MRSSDHFQNQAKKKLLGQLLEQEFALVYVDSEAPELLVPPELKSAPSITLKLSNNFNGKMELREDLIYAELLFGDHYSTCEIPYPAIWAMADTVAIVKTWSEAIPATVKPFLSHLGLKEDGTPLKQAQPLKDSQEDLKKEPTLSSAQDPTTPPSPKPPSNRPVLKRIK